jgi:hypothetical protein
MREALSFVEAIRAASGELRLEPHAPVRLNQIAARIDQLGRRVHGLGWTRDHEIGGCLTAAVRELSRARDLPEVERTESVRQAIRELETALTHTDEGLRPQQAEPVTELTAQEATRDG